MVGDDNSSNDDPQLARKRDEQRRAEKRKKALEHAAGWSGATTFAPGTSSFAADDGFDWVCAKCMRKNTAGSTECGRCMAPKTVAPGSRALASLAANKTKKIHKI